MLNFGLTVGWLWRLFFTRHPEFHRLRRAATVTFLGAQPVFLLFPTAPPRTLDEFVDTIQEVSGFDLDSGLVAKLYNPLAAMPSIHVAFAVVTAARLAETSPSRVVRRLAPGYPPLVAFTVFVTANHYVLDGVAAPSPLACKRRADRLGLRAMSGAPGHGLRGATFSRTGELSRSSREIEDGRLDRALRVRPAERVPPRRAPVDRAADRDPVAVAVEDRGSM